MKNYKLITALGVVLVAVALWAEMRPSYTTTTPIPRVSLRSPVVYQSWLTLAKFKQLDPGISYSDAVRILGRSGEEISRVDMPGIPTTVMYQWGEGLANMNAMFQDDRLITKAQFGLK